MPRVLRLILPVCAFFLAAFGLSDSRQAEAAPLYYGTPSGVSYWVDGYGMVEGRVLVPQRVAPPRRASSRKLDRSRTQVAHRSVAERRASAPQRAKANRFSVDARKPGFKAKARLSAKKRQALQQRAGRHAAAGATLGPDARFSRVPERLTIREAQRVASLGETPNQRRLAAEPASHIEARVDIASQRMIVKVDGEVRHVWKVSTGRKGFSTPRGAYKPQRMHVRYFSRKYYNSPMPYSIFFRGGYAIHGTTAINRLGGPASHGCVRLATGNARALFQLVQQAGPARTRIIIG
jgi:lipoprotein-anchoring transpeptidase ErfK/SrfK